MNYFLLQWRAEYIQFQWCNIRKTSQSAVVVWSRVACSHAIRDYLFHTSSVCFQWLHWWCVPSHENWWKIRQHCLASWQEESQTYPYPRGPLCGTSSEACRPTVLCLQGVRITNSLKKTKITAQDSDVSSIIMIDDTLLEEVKTFIYRGSTVLIKCTESNFWFRSG